MVIFSWDLTPIQIPNMMTLWKRRAVGKTLTAEVVAERDHTYDGRSKLGGRD